ncbi:MAG: BlaI/MecI/CopY family transcriptional regulator [bacterium]
MKDPKHTLTRRENQVMDIIYAQGQVSATQVQAALPDKPSYSATRMLLQRLNKKGLISYSMQGAKYIYAPVTPKVRAGKAAWTRLVQTFFGGSSSSAFSALLGASSDDLTDDELDELQQMVADVKAKRK